MLDVRCRESVEIELAGVHPGGTLRLKELGLTPLRRGAIVRVGLGLADRLCATGMFVKRGNRQKDVPMPYGHVVVRDRAPGVDTRSVHATGLDEATNRSTADRAACKG